MVTSRSSLIRFHPEFVLGVLFGICTAFIANAFRNIDCSNNSSGIQVSESPLVQDKAYWSAVRNEAGDRDHQTEGKNLDTVSEVQEERNSDFHPKKNDYSVARDLYQKVRVLCWIMTSPKNLYKKAIHVRNTWGPRCNVLLFMSSVEDKNFPTIGLNVEEGRRHLTAKTMLAFSYIYDNHFHDADWFMKADDDTYVIVENLRYFLSGEDFKKAVYFGHIFQSTNKSQGFPSGGGGYIISKEALMRFGERRNDPRFCKSDGGAEDVRMGRCLKHLGVLLKSSLDSQGKSRFHCFDPDFMIKHDFPDWYLRYDSDGVTGGVENISDYAITFHYISPDKMYSMEYYTYHLKPYGIAYSSMDLDVKL